MVEQDQQRVMREEEYWSMWHQSMLPGSNTYILKLPPTKNLRPMMAVISGDFWVWDI